MAQKLVDLKRTAADKKAERAMYEDRPYLSSDGDYGYGLTIRLDNEMLAKLGIDPSVFGPDKMVMVCAKGMVTEETSNTRNGKTVRSMAIQLQQVSVEPEGEEEDAAKILYGKE